MWRWFVAILILIPAAESTCVETPETVVIRARRGNITFSHKKHEDYGVLKDCMACHNKDTGDKLGKQGMATGHSMCRKCHSEAGLGPRDCDGCHK
jgi:hypothetical protein